MNIFIVNKSAVRSAYRQIFNKYFNNSNTINQQIHTIIQQYKMTDPYYQQYQQTLNNQVWNSRQHVLLCENDGPLVPSSATNSVQTQTSHGTQSPTTAQIVRQSSQLHTRFDQVPPSQFSYSGSGDSSRQYQTARTHLRAANNLTVFDEAVTQQQQQQSSGGAASRMRPLGVTKRLHYVSPRAHRPGQPVQQQMSGSNNGIADEAWPVEAHSAHNYERSLVMHENPMAELSVPSPRSQTPTNRARQNNATTVKAVYPETSPQSDANEGTNDDDDSEENTTEIAAAKQVLQNLQQFFYRPADGESAAANRYTKKNDDDDDDEDGEEDEEVKIQSCSAVTQSVIFSPQNSFSPGELHPKRLQDVAISMDTDQATRVKQKQPSLPPVSHQHKISLVSLDQIRSFEKMPTVLSVAIPLQEQQSSSDCHVTPRFPVPPLDLKANKISLQTTSSNKASSLTSFEHASNSLKDLNAKKKKDTNAAGKGLKVPRLVLRDPQSVSQSVSSNDIDELGGSKNDTKLTKLTESKQSLDELQPVTIKQGDTEIVLSHADLMKILSTVSNQQPRINNQIHPQKSSPQSSSISSPSPTEEQQLTMADIVQTGEQSKSEKNFEYQIIDNEEEEEKEVDRVEGHPASDKPIVVMYDELQKSQQQHQHQLGSNNPQSSSSTSKNRFNANIIPYGDRESHDNIGQLLFLDPRKQPLAQTTSVVSSDFTCEQIGESPKTLAPDLAQQLQNKITNSSNDERMTLTHQSAEPLSVEQPQAMMMMMLPVDANSGNVVISQEKQKLTSITASPILNKKKSVTIIDVIEEASQFDEASSRKAVEAAIDDDDDDDEYAQLLKQMQQDIDAESDVLPPLDNMANLPTVPVIKPQETLATVMKDINSKRPPMPISRNNITDIITVTPLKHSYESNSNKSTIKRIVTFDDKTKEAYKKDEVVEIIPESSHKTLGHSTSMPFDKNDLSITDQKSNPFDGQLDVVHPQPVENEFSSHAKGKLSELLAPNAAKDQHYLIDTPNFSQAQKNYYVGPSFCEQERTMTQNIVDEDDTSHLNSTYLGQDHSYLDSQTGNSNKNIGQARKLGLNGKSTDFKTGDLRQKNLRLNYFDLNHDSQNQMMLCPQTSGNRELDQLGIFAFSHGIDPNIFIDQDQQVSQQSLEQLIRQVAPKQSKYRRSPINQNNNQHGTYQSFIKQEVNDLHRLMLESPSFNANLMRQQPRRFEQTREVESFMLQQQLVTDNNLMMAGQNQNVNQPNFFHQLPHQQVTGGFSHMLMMPEQQLLDRRRNTLNDMNSRSPQSCSSSPTLQKPNSYNRAADRITNLILDETIKNKAQIQVLSMAYKCFMNNQDRQKARQINRIIRILEQHEAKLEQINVMTRVFKKKIHFAFLFASPIVVEQKDKSFRYFPQLNFAKEFVKIRESISAAQVLINITKRQCTIESMQEVLAQNPIGLHFSGHGILNNQDMGVDFYEQHKGQGDFLVLENHKGGSELVSCQQLKKMIRQNKCELEFVFVATCHSEFVGRIFQEAGAKHVICIVHDREVKDDAVITFTDTFYSMIFEQNQKICTAFSQAKLSVEISFSRDEANIFKLLLREQIVGNGANGEGERHSLAYQSFQRPSNLQHIQGEHDETIRSSRLIRHNGRLHVCKPFGPFQKGRYNYVEHQIVHLQNRAPKMPKLMGRQKDMFRVMDKILNSKSSRLFNIIGWSGMGKSALVASILDYIAERGLLKGGSIYFNARNISMCEMFIRNFNQVLISENPSLFGIARERDQVKNEPIKTLESILSKISIIEGDIVLVIDNAEELIISERNDFCMLISMMLTRVSQLKILLTSQRPLQKTFEFKEEKIILSNLSNCQSANLFREVMARRLEQEEINNLLNTKPNYDKYPLERFKKYLHWYDHHLFTLLDGNPQSIILVASLCADPQKQLQLNQIYKMLTDSQLFKVLEEEGIEESNLVSLRLSATISFQAIEESDPESIDLLYLLGLLPGGVSPRELDDLWGKVTHKNRKMHIEAHQNQQQQQQSSFNGSSQQQQRDGGAKRQKMTTSSAAKIEISKQSAWRRAFAELKKGHLAEEKQAYKRSYNAQAQDGSPEAESGQDFSSGFGASYGAKGEHHHMLGVHDGVMGEQDLVIILPEIVRTYSEGKITEETSDFFVSILSDWYKNQLSEIYIKNENIIYSSHQAGKQRSTMAREFDRLEENIKMFILRMQEKYQQDSKLGVSGSGGKEGKSKQLYDLDFETTSDDSSLNDDVEEIGMAERLFSKSVTLQKVDSTQSTPDTFKLASEVKYQNTEAPSDFNLQLSTNAGAGREIQVQARKSNFPELRDAYIATNLKKETLDKYEDAMKPNNLQHPKYIEDRIERAYAYWRWAFDRTKNQQDHPATKEGQEVAQSTAKIQLTGNDNLEESFDSDQSHEKDFDEQVDIDGAKQQSHKQITRMSSKQRLLEQISMQNNKLLIKIQRGSIKDRRKEQPSQLAAYSRLTSRMSVYEKRMTMFRDKDKTNHDELSVDEITMVYYLVNLILYKQYNVVNVLIKKHILPMKKCSDLFKANVRRFQALSLYQLTKMEKYTKVSKIERCLKRAEKHFKRSQQCPWGLGLTYFQQAILLLYQLDNRPASAIRTQKQAMLDQSKALYLEAAKQFQLVNHWRGLCNTFRLLDQLMGKHFKQDVDLTERRKYSDLYKKYLDFYDVQRFSDHVDSNLTIQRVGGDELSLMTEIVMHKRSDTKLFAEPELLVNVHSFGGSSNDDFGEEEIHSYQNQPPRLKVIPDNDELFTGTVGADSVMKQMASKYKSERKVLSQGGSIGFLVPVIKKGKPVHSSNEQNSERAVDDDERDEDHVDDQQ